MMIAVTLGFSGCKSNNGDKAQLTANEWQLKEMTTTKGKTALPQRVPTLMSVSYTHLDVYKRQAVISMLSGEDFPAKNSSLIATRKSGRPAPCGYT